MRGDFSRVTFRPENHYSGVRLQQGRVHLDADFNEHVDIEAHRDRMTTLDVVGRAGAPYESGGFRIGVGANLGGIDLAGGLAVAVGEDGTILQRSPVTDPGATWALLVPSVVATHLHAVHLLSATEGWAVGQGGAIVRLQGSSWSDVRQEGLTAHLHDVHFSASADGWAVGSGGAILHWDGSSWSPRPAAGVTGELYGVHFVDAQMGWAVGAGGVVVNTIDSGQSWARQSVPNGVGTLRAVHFPTSTRGCAVGDGGTILVTDDGGGTWSRRTVAGLAATLRAVRFADADADADRAWAVGDEGTIVTTADGGQTWTGESTLGAASLRAVETDGAIRLAAGDDVVLSRDAAGTWQREALPAGARNLMISAGDMYVDGLRLENDTAVALTSQPDSPGAVPPRVSGSFPATEGPGTYGIYLRVWQDHLTALEEEWLREVALGGPDTATRTRTVWQVDWLKLAAGATCDSFESSLRTSPPRPASDGRLRARAEPAGQPSGECLVPPAGGYRRLENQLYRVEVHEPGPAGTATFKWSRDNGSVASALVAVDKSATADTGQATVSQPGRDEVLAFAPGQWVELTDRSRTLRGQPGILARIAAPVHGDVLKLADFPPGTGALSLADFPGQPLVRRWDGRGTVQAGPSLELEDGLRIEFAGGPFQSGDYWTIPARTLTGAVEWPGNGTAPPFLEPEGVRYHHAPLALVTLDANRVWSSPVDCRRRFPPLSGLTDIYYVGGDGQEVMPDLGSDGALFVQLPRPLEVGVANWRWPIPGATVRFTVHDGGGKLNGTTVDTFDALTGPNGVASVSWHLSRSSQHHRVEARLLDELGQPAHTPVFFNANLSVAAQVAYDPGNCVALSGATNLQAATTRLSKLTGIHPLSGTGFDLMPAGGPLTLQVIALNHCGPVDGATVQFSLVPGQGNGTLTGATVSTANGGIATCTWAPDPTTPTQQVQATLTEVGGDAVKHRPDRVRFVANLSLASQVAYEPPADCQALAHAGTVQSAIDGLARRHRLYHVVGDGLEARPGEELTLAVGTVDDCGPVDAEVRFEVTQGDGSLETTDPVSSEDGVASCVYVVGSDPRQQVRATLAGEDLPFVAPVHFNIGVRRAAGVGYDPAKCPPLAGADDVQDAIDKLCTIITPPEMGIKVVDVLLAGQQLRPGAAVTADALRHGIQVVCNQSVAPEAANNATCFLTLELPYPVTTEEGSFWGTGPVGTTPLTLDASVSTSPRVIQWTPQPQTVAWLENRLFQVLQGLNRPVVIGRLTLKGDHVWGESPQLRLDPEIFARPGAQPFPSGDDRRGGTGELWFSLSAPAPPRQPTVRSIRPLVVQQGDGVTAVITGNMLGGAEGLEFDGEDVHGEVTGADEDTVELFVEVAEHALPGRRPFHVATAGGLVHSDPVALTVLVRERPGR
ncbi:MAG: DUF6519 domain-containing protein [Actinomycetota bacterium]|nr:DUF6519 domain-containing protein [Actinomycetota bacterium]